MSKNYISLCSPPFLPTELNTSPPFLFWKLKILEEWTICSTSIQVEQLPSTVPFGGEAQAHKLLLHLQYCNLLLASVKLREEPANEK